jgi:hypothetical protein
MQNSLVYSKHLFAGAHCIHNIFLSVLYVAYSYEV